MKMDKKSSIAVSTYKGYVDRNGVSRDDVKSFFSIDTEDENLKPTLLSNSNEENVWEKLRYELETCNEFVFAVAFFSEDILVPFKAVMADLNESGIHGRILTSDYLYFNKPKVFRELMKIANVEVRISSKKGFHAKGYIFNHSKESYKTVILGSSNFTGSALLKNYEWNLKFSSYDNSELTTQIFENINETWCKSVVLSEKWINDYQKTFDLLQQTQKREIDKSTSTKEESFDGYTTIKPNKMQKDALVELNNIRKSGEKKSLVISATGTGKTYLGAFDVRQFNPKKFLFIVHREQILKKSMKSFMEVIGGPSSNFGILSGTKNETYAKYLFATEQSLARESNLKQFRVEEFDYILIDEAHRTGAKSYLRILNYFKPKFILGMTATPERTDDFNIFELFDYNIAYEIRLQDALKEEMLVPFQYIGVKDFEVDGKRVDDNSSLKYLASEDRVKYVLDQVNYYGFSGATAKGLIFCSRNEEAQLLAEQLTRMGHPTQSLSGQNKIQEREVVVKKLETGEIEYITSVDIFNEGIDIPCVNQIILLRSTQSSIVFIQQLGRGLRKYNGKDFVTVIDFIGNYKNNYLIPIALTGDKSRNKDIARENVNFQPTIGLSTISFTKVAKERIFESLNNIKLDSLGDLKEAYFELKRMLGRVPMLSDFKKYGSVDPNVFADSKNLKNYYEFLKIVEKYRPLKSELNSKLTMLTKELLNGKRPHELILLNLLLKDKKVTVDRFSNEVKSYGAQINQSVIESTKRVLSLEYFTKTGQKNYGETSIVTYKENSFLLDNIFNDFLKDEVFKKFVLDIVQTGLLNAKDYDFHEVFTRYKRYTRKDVSRLLNFETDCTSTIYGYKVANDCCPIFVTYKKSEEIGDSIKYQDKFLDSKTMKWYSRSNRQIQSKEIQKLIEGVSNLHQKRKIYLFVKKDDAEGLGFYFLGECLIDGRTIVQEELKIDDSTKKPIVSMNLILDKSVQYRRFLDITTSISN
ncbi:DEAD/DEAH box helicase [Liquorilactobacillus cacaonum]|nr:DEAD/DEAH box helicase [Liquorilactobacillus cacaonum]